MPGSSPAMTDERAYEQPVVDPHVSHFMQVPLRTSVKLPHSPQASPSYPLARASARFSAAAALACVLASAQLSASSCVAGESFASGSSFSAVAPAVLSAVTLEALAIDAPPRPLSACPPPGAARAAPPSPLCGEGEELTAVSLSVRLRVR